MSPLTAQRLIAIPFLALGAWCLLLPDMVARLSLRPEHYRPSIATSIMIGCFGAQAILSGLFAWFSRFGQKTFLAYGIALLPFFVFNYWFVFVVPVFSPWMALDFGANMAMFILCVIGYRSASPKAAR
jgi:hypothetical protein